MRLRRHIALLALFVAAEPAAAQIPPPPPACSTGRAMEVLQGRDVRAPVYNTGSLFYRDSESPEGYRDAAGRRQLLLANLWVGAQFDGFLFLAGSMFGPYEFWPGPLDETGLPPVDCAPYDRIWSISRDDILQYNATGVISADLRDWPAWAGAPVSDGDGNPDNYNLAGGDRPALMGDRMRWWVMNDRAGAHEVSQAIPIQVQVEATAFSYDLPGVLGRSTFYRYRIMRRGIFPFIQAHVGLFVYAGLGDILDDYVGADTTLSLAYVYNADGDDPAFQGQVPPAVGVGILRGSGPDVDGGPANPRSLDTRRMTSMVAYRQLCEDCNPFPDGPGYGFYNLMRGRWPWGDQVVFPGNTQGGPIPTPVMYPGTPPEFWSEANFDGQGTAALPGDRKLVVATGPYTLVPDEVSEVVFAVITSTGTDHFDSVAQLEADVAFVQEQTSEILTPMGPGPSTESTEDYPLAVSRVWPNPASEEAWLELSLPVPMETRIELFDLLGRRVRTTQSGVLEEGSHRLPVDLNGLPPGIYAWRAQTGRFSASGTLVVAR